MSGLPPVATELRTSRIGSFGPNEDIGDPEQHRVIDRQVLESYRIERVREALVGDPAEASRTSQRLER